MDTLDGFKWFLAMKIPLPFHGRRTVTVTKLKFRNRDCLGLQILRVEDSEAKDEFYYRFLRSSGTVELRPVPNDFVLPGFSHCGFGMRDTAGRGPGYSWFIYIGPPKLRAKEPLGNWDKVVDDYSKAHEGKKRVEFSGPYPTPGRVAQAVK